MSQLPDFKFDFGAVSKWYNWVAVSKFFSDFYLWLL